MVEVLLHSWTEMLMEPMLKNITVHPSILLCYVLYGEYFHTDVLEAPLLLVLASEHWLEFVLSCGIHTPSSVTGSFDTFNPEASFLSTPASVQFVSTRQKSPVLSAL